MMSEDKCMLSGEDGTTKSMLGVQVVSDLRGDALYKYLVSVSANFNPAAGTPLGMRGYVTKLSQLGRVIAAVVPGVGVVGVLAGYFNSLEQGFSFISAFHVMPSFRKMHIGRMLMDRAAEISRDVGFKSIRLKVDKVNVGGISFYERYGFVKIGEDARQFEMNYNL